MRFHGAFVGFHGASVVLLSCLHGAFMMISRCFHDAFMNFRGDFTGLSSRSTIGVALLRPNMSHSPSSSSEELPDNFESGPYFSRLFERALPVRWLRIGLRFQLFSKSVVGFSSDGPHKIRGLPLP